MCKRRLWKQALPLALMGTWRWVLFLETERQMKRSSGNGTTLSVGALRGEPGGRTLLLGALKDVYKGGLWRLASLSIGTQWGNWRGGSFTWNFKKQ